jgi:ABC-type transport system involved in multi-copper enzyme maturation permease subunit
MGGHDPFGRLVLAEWTKLRSVPRWLMALAAVVGLTLLVAVFDKASDSSSDAEEGEPLEEPDFSDRFHFVHQPLTGDGSIVARVVSQEDSHEWAKAGLIMKERLEVGAPYAAVLVTPDHGVRMQWDFDHDVAGSDDGAAPRWLRLTRSGDTVTGYESADATNWQRVGEVDLDNLPPTVEVGLFVASPDAVVIKRQYGSNSVNETPTRGEAVFDRVSVEAAGGSPSPRDGEWSDYDSADEPEFGGSSTESGGVFTVMGSGDIAKVRRPFGDDLVELSLSGAAVGMLAAAALGALFMTAEFKRGMIRTTFAASPGRGRVLAAKAIVLGGATFAAGLVASVIAFLVSQASLRNTSRTPGLPELSLANLTVLRAVVGTAVLIALVAVLSLAVATIVRHTALAIPLVVLPLLVPSIVEGGLPLSVENWLTRLTPAAGFAVQQTITRYDTAIAPLVGLGVLAVYVAVALGVATSLLRRRDA